MRADHLRDRLQTELNLLVRDLDDRHNAHCIYVIREGGSVSDQPAGNWAFRTAFHNLIRERITVIRVLRRVIEDPAATRLYTRPVEVRGG